MTGFHPSVWQRLLFFLAHLARHTAPYWGVPARRVAAKLAVAGDAAVVVSARMTGTWSRLPPPIEGRFVRCLFDGQEVANFGRMNRPVVVKVPLGKCVVTAHGAGPLPVPEVTFVFDPRLVYLIDVVPAYRGGEPARIDIFDDFASVVASSRMTS